MERADCVLDLNENEDKCQFVNALFNFPPGEILAQSTSNGGRAVLTAIFENSSYAYNLSALN